MKSLEPYRQFVPQICLSLESNTDNVPKDGFFYVLKDGDMIGRFGSLKQALDKYRALRDALLPPKEQGNNASSASHMDQYLLDKELYWAEAHRFRHRGGKGGRGGV